MKTPEQLKEYKKLYYQQHKDHYNQLVAEWRKANPIQAKAIADRWHAKRPHYQRDYVRKRKAITEPLIFQFLDNGFGNNLDAFILYLRSRGVSEKYIKWFKVDCEKMIISRGL